MDALNIKGTAHVKLTKLDERGNVIEIKELDVDLTDKEVNALCLSQQQD